MTRTSRHLPEGVGAGGADDTAGSADDTGAETLCPEDVDLFEERVWDPVLSTYCVGCHVSDGPAAGTRMVFKPDDMLHNLRAASDVVDLLLLKPTGLHEAGHAGGALVLPETEAWEALEFWVDWTNGICEEGEEGCEDGPLPRRLRRLDHSEYQRTIEDLLGIATDHAETLAPTWRLMAFQTM